MLELGVDEPTDVGLGVAAAADPHARRSHPSQSKMLCPPGLL